MASHSRSNCDEAYDEAAQIRTLATQQQQLNEELEALDIERDVPEAVAEPGIGKSVLAFVILPMLAMFEFGLYAAGVGLLALGFALYKAWDLTDGKVSTWC